MRWSAIALVPAVVLVAASAAAAPEVVLRWSPMPDAVEYEVEIARDPAFTDVVATARTLEPRHAWSELPASPHHWRVRCRYRWGRAGPWSPVRIIEPVVGPARPRSPPEGAEVSTTSLRFEFDSPPAVLEHVLEIAADPRFEAIVHRTAASRGRVEIETPSTGRYWWRVAGVDALGRPVPPSPGRSFTVAVSAGAAAAPTPPPGVATHVADSPPAEEVLEGEPLPVATLRVPRDPVLVADRECLVRPRPLAAIAAPETVPFPAPVRGPPVRFTGEASAGWISNGGWLRAPRADAALVAYPMRARAWSGGVSAGWYAREGRDDGASFGVSVLPVSAFARWSPGGDAWIGAGVGIALVSTRLATDAGRLERTGAVPFVAPAVGFSRRLPAGSAGASLSWTRLPVGGPVHGDAGGISLSVFFRPGELR